MTSALRPAADEYAAAFAGYVESITDHKNILEVLAAQLPSVLTRLGSFDESRGNYRYAQGKWSIKEIVGHLCDTERVFAYRALRFARGDTTPVPSFDDQAYVAEVRAEERTLMDLAQEWGDVRRSSLALFRHLPAVAWERRGTASGHPVSVRALAYIIAGHVRHHVTVLEERYTE
jgi:DinB superfamily